MVDFPALPFASYTIMTVFMGHSMETCISNLKMYVELRKRISFCVSNTYDEDYGIAYERYKIWPQQYYNYLTKRSNTSKSAVTKISSTTPGMDRWIYRERMPFASVSFRFMGVATSDSSIWSSLKCLHWVEWAQYTHSTVLKLSQWGCCCCANSFGQFWMGSSSNRTMRASLNAICYGLHRWSNEWFSIQFVDHCHSMPPLLLHSRLPQSFKATLHCVQTWAHA